MRGHMLIRHQHMSIHSYRPENATSKQKLTVLCVFVRFLSWKKMWGVILTLDFLISVIF